MGDWEDIENEVYSYPIPIEANCYYQDDKLNWIENMKCTPWTGNSKTIKAWQTQAKNTYTSFELSYNAYFKTKGSVEFKYRKDSKGSIIVNGDFKFAVNGQEKLVDYNQKHNGWQVQTVDIEAPGMYQLLWIYTKYTEEGVTESMSAEIEYIRIKGLEYSAFECQPCKKGWSQAGSARCSVCGANSYIDTSTNTQECKKCPTGYFSFPGSVGNSSCQKMSACTKSDILTTYGECQDGLTRNISYQWIQPQYCNINDSSSVSLPSNTTTECRNCGRGQRYINGGCEFCPEGAYSNKVSTRDSQTTECTKCPSGTAAVKVLEFVDFEEIPSSFVKYCQLIDQTKTSQEDCDKFYGWRADNGKLDTVKNILFFQLTKQGAGIANGISLSLSTTVKVVDEINGKLEIDFKTTGFSLAEKFVVYINGENSTNQNSKEDKQTFISYLEPGTHKIEFAFENNGTSTNIQAQVLISKILIHGTTDGGAIECKTCADGFFNDGKSFTCTKCSPGHQTNEDQSQCVICPEGYYNPISGGSCKKCPKYTYPSTDKQFCIPFDEIITEESQKFHLHILQSTEVCSKKQSQNFCNSNGIMGPIFKNESSNFIGGAPHTGDIYFLGNHQKFDMKMYEYHETKDSIQNGYIFALFSLQNESLSEITQKFDDDNMIVNLNNDCLEELKSLKIKKNLGSQIKSISEYDKNGYTVHFDEGDICDQQSNNEKYTSEIRYICNDQSEDLGWPDFVKKVGKCHYQFQWVSRWACPQCQQSDVLSVVTSCVNGNRTIANLPHANCIVVPQSSTATTFIAPEADQNIQYVNYYQLKEPCYLSDELMINPVLQAMTIFMCILFVFILITMGCILFKYRNLKVRYSRLSDNDAAGEIEMQTR